MLNNLDDESIKTKLGFVMHFKHTGHSTNLRKQFITGSHERFYLSMLRKIISEGDYVIDIGANEGYFSLFFSTLVGKEGMVFAIEPNRENIWFLKQNITYNTMNIKVIEKAISDKKTESNFYYEDGMGAWGRLVDDQSFKNKKIVKVKVDRVDNIFNNIKKRIKFLKIDVEGNELNVFYGAEKTLSLHKPHLFFEIQSVFWANMNSSVNTMLNFLKNKGYELFVLGEDNRLHEYKAFPTYVFNMFAIHETQKSELQRSDIFYNCNR